MAILRKRVPLHDLVVNHAVLIRVAKNRTVRGTEVAVVPVDDLHAVEAEEATVRFADDPMVIPEGLVAIDTVGTARAGCVPLVFAHDNLLARLAVSAAVWIADDLMVGRDVSLANFAPVAAFFIGDQLMLFVNYFLASFAV